jgi:hypothetical protein
VIETRIYRRAFWTGSFDAVGIARLRFAFGLLLLYDFLERLRDFYTFYTGRGLLTPVDHHFTTSLENFSLLSLFQSPPAVALVWAAAIVSMVAFTLGWRARLANLLGLIFLLSIQRRASYILDGADGVEREICFWLLFIDTTAAWSLDARLGRRTPADRIPAFPVRLLQLQMALIYFFAGLHKSELAWYGGAALEGILRMRDFARPAATWLLHFPQLCALLSRMVPPLEMAIGVALMTPWRRVRLGAVLAAVGLHLGILVTMRVGLFSIVMPVGLLVFVDRARPGPVTVAPTRRDFIASTLAAALMALVLASVAIEAVAGAERVPPAAQRVLGTLGLAQSWSMFTGGAGTVDYAWQGRGRLADGREVDLHDSFPQLFDAPMSFTYSRWMKLRENMTLVRVRNAVMRYICRRYNADAAVPLTDVDLYTYDRRSPRLRPWLIAHQDCSSAPPPPAVAAPPR